MQCWSALQKAAAAAAFWAMGQLHLQQDTMGDNRPAITSVPGENCHQSRSPSNRNKQRNTLLDLHAPTLENTRRAPPPSTTDSTSVVTSSVCEPEETIYLGENIPACSNIASRQGGRLYSINGMPVHPPSVPQVAKSKPDVDIVTLPGQVEEISKEPKRVHFAPDFKLSQIVEDDEMLLHGEEMNFSTEIKRPANSLSTTCVERCPEDSTTTRSYTSIQTFKVPLNQSKRAKQYKFDLAQPSKDLHVSRTVQQRRRPDTPFQFCRGESRRCVRGCAPHDGSLLPAHPISHKYQLPEQQPVLSTSEVPRVPWEIAFPRDNTVPALPYVPMPGSIFMDDDFDLEEEWNSIPVYETVLSDDDSSDDDHSDAEFGDEESINSLESYLRSDDEEMRGDDRDLLGLFQKDMDQQAFEEKVKRLKQRYPHERLSMIHRIICRQSTEKGRAEQWKRKEEKRKRKLKKNQRKQAEKEKSHMRTVAGMARFAARQIAILSGHSQRTESDRQPSITKSVEKKKRNKRTAPKKEG